MKKVILLASVLSLFGAMPASADVNIDFSLPGAAAEPVVVQQPTYVVEHPYPVHVEKHHNYDWKYWRDHKEHEEHHDDHHDIHDDHGHY